MLDIKFIRENPEKVKEGLRKKKVKIDIDRLLELDEKRRVLLRRVEELRAEQNKISADKEAPKEKLEAARELKEKIDDLEYDLKEIDEEFNKIIMELPNLPLEGVPEGRDEKDNVILREVGEKPKFNFAAKDYLEIAQNLDLIDAERAGKVSGTRFGYLKREAALLEFALVQFAFEILTKEDFIPVIPPVLIKPESLRGMGYIDTESDKGERYFLEKDELYLVGTSEQSIGPMHKDEILKKEELPKRYAAFSSCFRREAGSYGKDTKGILRVHQFDKVEMFSFCHPEKSKEEHQFLLSLEEKLMQALKISYRVVQLCTGDLSRPSAATFDIETWMPGQNEGQGQYRETHSTSNCADFQARRLNIRYKNAQTGKNEFIHTLNGTAFAIGRMIIAIIENYQQKDGSVKVPEVLQKYMPGSITSVPFGKLPDLKKGVDKSENTESDFNSSKSAKKDRNYRVKAF
ncbi:MAG: serine--tRNA ligase [bacterium]|nr:serine--tRNA ligase [bacterium]